MGVGKFKPFCVSTGTASWPESAPRELGNPNPHRFTLLRVERVGESVVAEVVYPDCANYEGRKILVYACSTTYENAVRKGVLDPHFTDDGTGPIARFVPDVRGWEWALQFARSRGVR